MAGWIKLHRKILNHELFQEKRIFSKFEAWVDLLLQANWKDKKTFAGVAVPRGSFITSIRKLADRWGWSNNKVTGFMRQLRNNDMIAFFCDTKKTVITIVRYDLYQNDDTPINSPMEHECITEGTRLHTTKKVKKEKKIKNKDLKDLYAQPPSEPAKKVSTSNPKKREEEKQLEERFVKFWDAYPKKKDKKRAIAAWRKINPSDQLLATILVALEKQRAAHDWVKENGKYIPLPTSWLNGARWEDECPEPKARGEPNTDLDKKREKYKDIYLT